MTKRTLTAICNALSLAGNSTGAVLVVPAGPFKGGRTGRPGPGKAWEVKQGPALAAMLNARHAEPNAAMNFDYDHQTMLTPQNGQKALASGWARVFEWRDGVGLFAVDQAWTAVAKAHIDADEFRYVSPVIRFDGETGEVTDLLHVSLTNYPDVLQLPAVHEAVATLNALSANHQESDMDLLAQLIAALGLPADTKDTAALSAVTALKAKADKAPAPVSAAVATALGVAADATETVALSAVSTLKAQGATGDATTMQTIQALQGQIATLSAQINGDKVTALVEGAIKDGKLLPAQKDWATNLGKGDIAQLSAYLATAPKVAAGLGTTQSGGEGGEGQGGQAALDAVQTAVLSAMGLTADEFKAAAL